MSALEAGPTATHDGVVCDQYGNTVTAVFACETCGGRHRGSYSHQSDTYGDPGAVSRAVFAVVCPTDWLTDFWTAEGAL